MGYFWDNWVYKDVDFERNDYIKNFIYATACAGVLALLFFLVFVAGLHKRINVLVKIVCSPPCYNGGRLYYTHAGMKGEWVSPSLG